MKTNINTGICQNRLQQNKPCFFVNWLENGEQKYEFFSTVYSTNKLFEKLKYENKKL